MKREMMKHAQMLKCSLICSFISSASLLLCMIAEHREGTLYLSLIPCVFWMGLILEQYFFWKADLTLKRLTKKNNPEIDKGKIGILSFGKSKLGMVADGIFVIALVVFVILFIGDWGRESVQYILLFLIVFSFRTHCIANGKNYRYRENLLRERG